MSKIRSASMEFGSTKEGAISMTGTFKKLIHVKKDEYEMEVSCNLLDVMDKSGKSKTTEHWDINIRLDGSLVMEANHKTGARTARGVRLDTNAMISLSASIEAEALMAKKYLTDTFVLLSGTSREVKPTEKPSDS